jgi:hypothetical protein
MTAEEYRGQKLTTRSFRGRSLEGADFSGADLRGTDFTGANLRSAKLTDAKVGVAPKVGVAVLSLGVLVAVTAGIVIGWSVEDTREQIAADEWDEVAGGVSIALVLVVLVGVTIWRGVDVAIRVAIVLWAVIAALNVMANVIWEEVEWVALARATGLVVFVGLAVVAGVLGRVIGGVFGLWSVMLVAVLGGLATGQSNGGIGGVIVAVSLAVVSKRAVRGDHRDRKVRRLAHRLVRRWGTQFVDTDLSGADFTGTNTLACDARDALVDGVTWDPNLPQPLDVQMT